MSIPDWTYAEDYYAALLQQGGAGFEVRTDPVKGKGLFATRAFKEGDCVLKENALCCSQNMDEYLAGIPVCPQCLASLEAPEDVVKRVVGERFVEMMPKAPAGYVPPNRVPCRNADRGCTANFCSKKCEEKGWTAHHSVMCTGGMTPEGRDAFRLFTEENWVQDGVDFTDTHFLALRFISHSVARSRAGMTLEQAYAPIAQLIRAPIQKFTFSYLLSSEYETECRKPSATETDDEALSRRWKHFQQFKDRTHDDPVVKYAMSKETRTKKDMLARAVYLLAKTFDWSEDEVQFYTAARWSELLGAVLLNGQERSPNSEYVQYMCFMRDNGLSDTLKGFHKVLAAAGKSYRSLDSSSHGQGIYPVGACFNHNCNPNLQVSYEDENTETLVVNALRDIDAGEEMCISYIDESDAVEVRQQQLFDHYLFTCSCATCASEL